MYIRCSAQKELFIRFTARAFRLCILFGFEGTIRVGSDSLITAYLFTSESIIRHSL